mgnify:CR=1 FL=1
MSDYIDLASTDLFDILRTTRAMRRIKPDPIPEALVRRVLDPTK